MSNHMSDYLENKLLDRLLRNTAWTSPTSVYVALYTTSPTDAGGGTEVASGNGYSRQTMTGGWTVSSGGSSTRAYNTSAVTFSPCSTSSWGTVVAVGILDAASSGNLLFYGPLSANRTVEVGDVFSFPANSLGVTLT